MRILLSMLLLVLASQQSAAQSYGAFDMGALTNTLAQDHVTRQSQSAAPPAPLDRFGGGFSRLLQGQRQAAPAGYAAPFTPSPETRARLAEAMADAAARRDPGQAEAMRELVLSGRAIAEYERVLPSVGLDPHDAVDALAFSLLVHWGVAVDTRAPVTGAQAAGVRRQAANAYLAVAEQLPTQAARQEFAQALAIEAVILAGTHEAAVRADDRAALERYSRIARQRGRLLFGVDPAQLELTDGGFVP